MFLFDSHKKTLPEHLPPRKVIFTLSIFMFPKHAPSNISTKPGLAAGYAYLFIHHLLLNSLQLLCDSETSSLTAEPLQEPEKPARGGGLQCASS